MFLNVNCKCAAFFLLVRGMWVTILRDKVLNFGDYNLYISSMGWWVVRSRYRVLVHVLMPFYIKTFGDVRAVPAIR